MKFGYQMYSALPLCQTKDGLRDTMKRIAEIGYDGVEFFDYKGIPAAELKRLLREFQIDGLNAHVQLERWERDAEGEMQYAKEAGIPNLTIPWISPQLRNDSGYQKIIRMIPKLTELGKAYGIHVLYHNHDFEFAKNENGMILEQILAASPELGLELDTFWSYYAGVDSASYMKKMEKRLSMIHVKDFEELSGGGMAGGAEMPVFCALGQGKMDNQDIAKEAERQSLEWVVVEQDNSRIDLMQSAAISLENLKKLFR